MNTSKLAEGMDFADEDDDLPSDPEKRVSVKTLNRDLRQASRHLSDQEARYFVDSYYMIQGYRMRTNNQVRSMEAEPTELVRWMTEQNVILEKQIGVALKSYAMYNPIAKWAMGHLGIGPIIAAGLIAHIDIEKAPTVGHIWRYAGLDPTSKWEKGQKRPWNAQLKVLCWKIGDSFVKVHKKPKAYYGKVYADRKAYELAKNEAGDYAEQAERTLATKNIRDPETVAVYKSGKLPLGRIELRARRYAVKLFLSHLHGFWYEHHFKKAPPLPYPIAHLGHVHFKPAPEAAKAVA